MKLISLSYNKLMNLQMKIYRRLMIFLFNSTKKCKISTGVVINKRSSFSNVKIGFGTYLSVNSKIVNTEIGKFCSIGPNLLCGFGIHPINGISTSPAFYSMGKQNGFTLANTNKIEELKPIYIGNDVFIGANVTILDGVKIGDGVVIGAGAVVSKDIPPYAVAVGCPIKVIKYRFSPDVIEKLLVFKWWEKDTLVWKKVEKNFFDVQGFLKNIDQ